MIRISFLSERFEDLSEHIIILSEYYAVLSEQLPFQSKKRRLNHNGVSRLEILRSQKMRGVLGALS